MSDTIKDYLVGFGFDVDESGAGQIESMLKDLDSIVRNLGDVLMQATGQMQNFMTGMQQQSQAAEQSAGQIDQLSGSAQNYSGQADSGTVASNRFSVATRELGHAAGEASKQVSDAQESVKSFREEADKAKPSADKLADAMKTVKTVMKVVAGSAIVKGAMSFAKALYQEEIALTETAKKLHKTTAEARAHNNAIKAMGKTYEEIKKDKNLKATYDDLVKIGESLALPDGEVGVGKITEMVDSFNRLKMVGSYALNWIFYDVQKLADGPLKRMKGTLDSLSELLQKNLPRWSMGVAEIVTDVMRLATAFAKGAADIVKFLDMIPAPLKVIIALVGALIVLLKGGTLGRFMIILTAIGLLMDDFYTYLEGGESLLGPFWEKCVGAFEKIQTAIEDAGKAISDFWESSKDESGMVNLVLFGVKVGKWIVNGLFAGLGTFSEQIKKWITGSEDASWADAGSAIVEKIATAISTTLESATLIADAITDIINTNLSAEKVSAALTNAADFAKGIFSAIVAAIPGLGEGAGNVVESVFNAITALLNTVTSAQFASGLTTLATNLVEGIAGALTVSENTGASLIDKITGLINTNLTAEKMTAALTNASQFAKGIFDAIIASIPGLGEGVGNVQEAIINAITALLNTVTSEQFSAGLTSLATNLIQGISGAITTSNLTGADLINKIVGLVNDGLITEQLPALLTNAASFATGIIQAIIDEIPKLGESTGTILTSVVTGICTLLNGITGDDVTANLGGLASTLITGLGTAIGLAFNSAGDIVSGIANMLSTALEEGRIGDMLGNLGSLGEQIITAIGKGIMNAAGGAASLIDAIGQMLSAALNPTSGGESLIGDLSSFGQSIITAIVNAVGDVANGAQQIFTAIGNLFDGIEWDKVGTDLGQLATGLVDKLVSAIGGEGVDFEGVMTAIGTGLGKAVNGLATVALNIVNSLISYMLDPGSWVRLGEGLLAIVRGAFKGVLSFLDEALGGSFILDTDEQVEQLNSLAEAYENAKQRLEELGEADDGTWAQLAQANFDSLVNSIQDLSEQDLSDIGNSIATLISQINSGEGTPEEIDQWKASLQSYLELMQTMQDLSANGALAPNNTQGVNIEGTVTANVDGADSYDQVVQQMQSALQSGGPVSAEIEVQPEVKVADSADSVFEDSISQELEKSGATASPTVELTDVSVEAGDGGGIQEATQETIDNIIDSQEFTAAVTVKASVNVEVEDSNADTIGTEIGSTIGQNVASGIASISMFNDLVSQANEALEEIVDRVNTIVSQIVSKFGTLPGSVGSKFASAASSARNALSGLPSYVKSIVDKINQYISQIKSPKITTPSLGGKSEGGVVDKETVSRLGEGNKREYVIPVTKPNRAVPLLKRAAADLGLNVSSYANATKMLGGSAKANVTPSYASSTTNNSSSVTNNKSVNAPATINVYGSDARQTANLVEKNQEQLLLRNIKAAFA